MSTPGQFCLTTSIAGPQGATGAAGTNGTNGVNAYTTLTASFVMPAEAANVTAAVLDSTWMAVNQLIYVNNAGYMNVQSKPTATSVILRNEENTATGAYTGNAPPATVIATSNQVSPAGVQGPAGAAGAGTAPSTATYITQIANATLTNEQALSTLATGYMKVTNATGVISSQAVPIPIADGGTNGITAVAAFNNLSPVTTDGDIIIRDATNNVRLAANAVATRYLSNTGTNNRPAWAQIDLTNGVTGVLPTANGGTGATAAWNVHRNGVASAAIASGAATRIDYTTELFDTANIFDPATDRLTPTTSGYYQLTAQALWVEGTFAGGEVLTIAIYKNAAEVARWSSISINTLLNSQPGRVETLQLANGTTDYFEVYVTQNSGNPQNLDGAIISTFFCGHKVSA